MKGRNSSVISIRLPDDVVCMLQGRAKDMSVTEYLKQQILASCSETHSVNTVVNTTIPGLKIEGNRIVDMQPHEVPKAVQLIPRYNPNIHKAGDVVLKFYNGVWREVKVPSLDLDGNEIRGNW